MSDLFMNVQRHQRSRRAAAPTPSPMSSFSNGRQQQQFNGNWNGMAATENDCVYHTDYLNGDTIHIKEDREKDAIKEEDEDEDPFANILSIKLKKPKHWRWELTTSRSCSNIALPRILLYDHTGALLVDANSPNTEQVYRQEPPPSPQSPQDIQTPEERQHGRRRRRSVTRTKRATTAQLAPSIRQALDSEFKGLQIGEATPTPSPTISPSRSTSTSTPMRRRSTMTGIMRAPGVGGSCIDFYTNELPDEDYHQSHNLFERRSSSLKGVRFQVDDNDNTDLLLNGRHSAATSFPTPPSTVTTTTTGTTPTTNSSSSGPREKRRYRRSHSSGRTPASILERFSFNKGRFSSPEYAAEHEVQHAPRYYLRTSKAGTLVIQEDSFNRQRQHRRRRPKHSSNENILQSEGTPKSQSSCSLPKVQCAQLQASSLQNVTDLLKQQPKCQKAKHTVRRYRSDGNIMLQRVISTSEEDEIENTVHLEQAQPNARKRSVPHYGKDFRSELVTIDPDNRVYRAGQAPTAR